MKFIWGFLALSVSAASAISCKELIEIDSPEFEITSKDVFKSDATAISALTAIYSEMQSTKFFASGGPNSITFIAGLSADELRSFSNDDQYIEIEENSVDATNSIVKGIWHDGFKFIYYANTALEGLSSSNSITKNTRDQLVGEALFIRAFCNFYLTNLFGEIPLALSTNYQANTTALQVPVSQIYDQVVKDLTEAETLLVSDYSFSNGERVRPNKWAAAALLARVYLYTENWASSEEQSTKVISNVGTYQLLDSLNNVFLANSKEAIWQLMPVEAPFNTNEGLNFILDASPKLTGGVVLKEEFISAFENGDHRKSDWINAITEETETWFYPFKYKTKQGKELLEYSMVLRLSELYLIRAESRAMMNDLLNSKDDLNEVRKRAGLNNTKAIAKDELLDAIAKERRVEFFTEWGHRWLDLKRTNHADSTLKYIKSPHWQPYDILYPIPASELDLNSNLTQNIGY